MSEQKIGFINPPDHWRHDKQVEWPIDSGNMAARLWRHQMAGMAVTRSISTMQDGSQWLHITLLRTDRIPTDTEVVKVRDEFIGQFASAYVSVPKSHVEMVGERESRVYAKHIWAPIDGDGTKLADITKIKTEVGV